MGFRPPTPRSLLFILLLIYQHQLEKEFPPWKALAPLKRHEPSNRFLCNTDYLNSKMTSLIPSINNSQWCDGIHSPHAASSILVQRLCRQLKLWTKFLTEIQARNNRTVPFQLPHLHLNYAKSSHINGLVWFDPWPSSCGILMKLTHSRLELLYCKHRGQTFIAVVGLMIFSFFFFCEQQFNT